MRLTRTSRADSSTSSAVFGVLLSIPWISISLFYLKTPYKIISYFEYQYIFFIKSFKQNQENQETRQFLRLYVNLFFEFKKSRIISAQNKKKKLQ